MRNDMARSAALTPGVCVELRQMWRVEMTTQEVSYSERSPWLDSILIRTVSGEGELCLRDGTSIRLPAESLIIADGARMMRHRVVGDHWNYWFFDFVPLRMPETERNTPLMVPLRPREEEQMLEILLTLRSRESTRLCLASSMFGALCARWLAYWETAERQAPERQTVDRIVALMHERLRDNWTVAGMASQSGVTMQHLRRLFLKVTGKNPKAYYDEMRLDYARQLLPMGWLNVGEVAEELGYSSAFHFSRAYKARFGVSPRGEKRGRREGDAVTR